MKKLFRAEPGYLMAYEVTSGWAVKIAGDNLTLLKEWLDTGVTNDFIQMLEKRDFLNPDRDEEVQAELKVLLGHSQRTIMIAAEKILFYFVGHRPAGNTVII